MSSKQYTTKTKYYETQQKSSRKSHKILQQCQKVIKELQSQLRYTLQQNQQKDQMIKLLTEQKQFYQQQSKKSDEKIYPKLKEQINFNQSLINGLKQHNKEITQKLVFIEQQNKKLWQKLQEKDQILKITENNLTKLQSQKSKLQRQWGQTLKCVKKKIFQLQQENRNSEKIVIDRDTNKSKQISKNKSGISIDHKRKSSINAVQKPKNQQKVSAVLKQIEMKLFNYDFLDMIQNKELHKEIRTSQTLQSNKQNIPENFIIGKYDKNDPKHKKVPILKLSELNFKEQY